MYLLVFITIFIIHPNSVSNCKGKFFYTNLPKNTVSKYEHNENKEYVPEYCEMFKLNSYNSIIFNDSDKLFSSACVQCLLCQTIAREYQNMLSSMFIGPCNMFVSDKLNHTLNNFCDTWFETFDLREYKEFRFVEPKSKNSKHVSCGVDGKWPRKLKEMCEIFMNNGEWNLYLRWSKEVKKSDFTAENFFCRSYGYFQYCRNIEIEANIERPRYLNIFPFLKQYIIHKG